jgi:hypothetical protein
MAYLAVKNLLEGLAPGHAQPIASTLRPFPGGSNLYYLKICN